MEDTPTPAELAAEATSPPGDCPDLCGHRAQHGRKNGTVPFTGTPTGNVPPRRATISFDLWMLASLGCLPLTLILLFMPEPGVCLSAWVFVGGVGIHCLVQARRGRSLDFAAFTGVYLLPAILFVAMGLTLPRKSPDYVCLTIGSSLSGLAAGFVVAKQIEAAILLCHYLGRRFRGEARRPAPARSLRERLDEESTPLEAPPAVGLPRRFGIRGMLIATTWAAVLMGGLRALGAIPAVYFLVLTFVAGTIVAQVVLFQGRKPVRTSMYAGAFLLPAEVLVLTVDSWLRWQGMRSRSFFFEFVANWAAGCAAYVIVGILLGAVAGAVGGWLYYVSEEFLLWLTRGVPTVALEPIAEADADVLLAWIGGPKLCSRWAGDQLAWPLDRKQLLDRFAVAQGEQPLRRIFKAVDARSGSMIGYVEFGGIDYQHRDAWLELPLVDPGASERGRIGVLMLRAVTNEAFEKLGLVSLKVSAEAEEPLFAACCNQAWLADFFDHPLAMKSTADCTTVYRRWTPWTEAGDMKAEGVGPVPPGSLEA